MSEHPVREFTVLICEQCLNLEGAMCNNPECYFCRRTMKEVSEYLDMLMIRPIIDGVQQPTIIISDKDNG